MTTKVIIGQSRQDVLPASVELEYATLDPSVVQSAVTGSTSTPKMTFSPVSSAVLNEIMGYISLGLTDLSIDAKNVPILMYKWHTWLNRMNTWMKENEKIYPKFLTLPQVSVPANLYFMSGIPMSNVSKQTAEAKIAPLGPLLPTEINTMLKALQKGVDTCGKTFEGTSHKTKNLSSFLLDMNRIAVYAIQPQKGNLSSSMVIAPDNQTGNITLVPGKITDVGNSRNDIVLPIPQVGVTKISSLDDDYEYDEELVETFAPQRGRAFTAPYTVQRRDKSKFNLPIWLWVTLLMVIFYYFVMTTGKSRRMTISDL